jgi:hypothetical protein
LASAEARSEAKGSSENEASTERMTGFTGTQICRLLVCVGEGCESLMDETMRDLACKGIQVDEIWSFVGTKQRRPTAHDNATKSGERHP